MVKRLVITVLISSISIFANESIYEKNCVACHKNFAIGLDKLFMSYLKKYSDEMSVKSALIDFLKNPNRATTAMSDDYIRRLGIKSKTDLNDSALKEAIDIYWQKYNVFDRIK